MSARVPAQSTRALAAHSNSRAAMLLAWLRLEHPRLLPPSQQASHPAGPASAFARVASDGVVLADVVSALIPAALPRSAVLRARPRAALSAPAHVASAMAAQYGNPNHVATIQNSSLPSASSVLGPAGVDKALVHQYRMNMKRVRVALLHLLDGIVGAPGSATRRTLEPIFAAAIEVHPQSSERPCLRVAELILAAALLGPTGGDYIWGVKRMDPQQVRVDLADSLKSSAAVMGISQRGQRALEPLLVDIIGPPEPVAMNVNLQSQRRLPAAGVAPGSGQAPPPSPPWAHGSTSAGSESGLSGRSVDLPAAPSVASGASASLTGATPATAIAIPARTDTAIASAIASSTEAPPTGTLVSQGGQPAEADGDFGLDPRMPVTASAVDSGLDGDPSGTGQLLAASATETPEVPVRLEEAGESPAGSNLLAHLRQSRSASDADGADTPPWAMSEGSMASAPSISAVAGNLEDTTGRFQGLDTQTPPWSTGTASDLMASTERTAAATGVDVNTMAQAASTVSASAHVKGIDGDAESRGAPEVERRESGTATPPWQTSEGSASFASSTVGAGFLHGSEGVGVAGASAMLTESRGAPEEDADGTMRQEEHQDAAPPYVTSEGSISFASASSAASAQNSSGAVGYGTFLGIDGGASSTAAMSNTGISATPAIGRRNSGGTTPPWVTSEGSNSFASSTSAAGPQHSSEGASSEGTGAEVAVGSVMPGSDSCGVRGGRLDSAGGVLPAQAEQSRADEALIQQEQPMDSCVPVSNQSQDPAHGVAGAPAATVPTTNEAAMVNSNILRSVAAPLVSLGRATQNRQNDVDVEPLGTDHGPRPGFGIEAGRSANIGEEFEEGFDGRKFSMVTNEDAGATPGASPLPPGAGPAAQSNEEEHPEVLGGISGMSGGQDGNLGYRTSQVGDLSAGRPSPVPLDDIAGPGVDAIQHGDPGAGLYGMQRAAVRASQREYDEKAARLDEIVRTRRMLFSIAPETGEDRFARTNSNMSDAPPGHSSQVAAGLPRRWSEPGTGGLPVTARVRPGMHVHTPIQGHPGRTLRPRPHSYSPASTLPLPPLGSVQRLRPGMPVFPPHLVANRGSAIPVGNVGVASRASPGGVRHSMAMAMGRTHSLWPLDIVQIQKNPSQGDHFVDVGMGRASSHFLPSYDPPVVYPGLSGRSEELSSGSVLAHLVAKSSTSPPREGLRDGRSTSPLQEQETVGEAVVTPLSERIALHDGQDIPPDRGPSKQTGYRGCLTDTEKQELMNTASRTGAADSGEESIEPTVELSVSQSVAEGALAQVRGSRGDKGNIGPFSSLDGNGAEVVGGSLAGTNVDKPTLVSPPKQQRSDDGFAASVDALACAGHVIRSDQGFDHGDRSEAAEPQASQILEGTEIDSLPRAMSQGSCNAERKSEALLDASDCFSTHIAEPDVVLPESQMAKFSSAGAAETKHEAISDAFLLISSKGIDVEPSRVAASETMPSPNTNPGVALGHGEQSGRKTDSEDAAATDADRLLQEASDSPKRASGSISDDGEPEVAVTSERSHSSRTGSGSPFDVPPTPPQVEDLLTTYPSIGDSEELAALPRPASTMTPSRGLLGQPVGAWQTVDGDVTSSAIADRREEQSNVQGSSRAGSAVTDRARRQAVRMTSGASGLSNSLQRLGSNPYEQRGSQSSAQSILSNEPKVQSTDWDETLGRGEEGGYDVTGSCRSEPGPSTESLDGTNPVAAQPTVIEHAASGHVDDSEPIGTAARRAGEQIEIGPGDMDWVTQDLLAARDVIHDQRVDRTLSDRRAAEAEEVLTLEREDAESVVTAMRHLLGEREEELRENCVLLATEIEETTREAEEQEAEHARAAALERALRHRPGESAGSGSPPTHVLPQTSDGISAAGDGVSRVQDGNVVGSLAPARKSSIDSGDQKSEDSLPAWERHDNSSLRDDASAASFDYSEMRNLWDEVRANIEDRVFVLLEQRDAELAQLRAELSQRERALQDMNRTKDELISCQNALKSEVSAAHLEKERQNSRSEAELAEMRGQIMCVTRFSQKLEDMYAETQHLRAEVAESRAKMAAVTSSSGLASREVKELREGREQAERDSKRWRERAAKLEARESKANQRAEEAERLFHSARGIARYRPLAEDELEESHDGLTVEAARGPGGRHRPGGGGKGTGGAAHRRPPKASGRREIAVVGAGPSAGGPWISIRETVGGIITGTSPIYHSNSRGMRRTGGTSPGHRGRPAAGEHSGKYGERRRNQASADGGSLVVAAGAYDRRPRHAPGPSTSEQSAAEALANHLRSGVASGTTSSVSGGRGPGTGGRKPGQGARGGTPYAPYVESTDGHQAYGYAAYGSRKPRDGDFS